MPRTVFPGGKRFAFSVIDDTDVATVENVTPIYRLFEELGLRTTKTVWSAGCPEGSESYGMSQTLEDGAYRCFIADLRRRGFEIASHGATMESSPRARTLIGLERFRDVVGEYPRIHINHSDNRENLYWGLERVDEPLLRKVCALTGSHGEAFEGQVEGSPYWWGDRCRQHVQYSRNLTFGEVNLDRINPSMPYADPARPLVPYWFSAADAEGATEFADLLTPRRVEALARDGGVCIVATHLGKGYAVDGAVPAAVRRCLEHLVSLDGWFPTVRELLDWLRQRRGGGPLPAGEWRRMQWRWFRDLLVRKARARSRLISFR